MKTFEIIASHSVCYRYTVKAESADEAEEKFLNGEATYDPHWFCSGDDAEIEEINKIDED